MHTAQFISIEGIDGSGKSTAIDCIAKYIYAHCGTQPLLSREPGGTYIAEKIRTILLANAQENANESLQPISEFLLLAAARAQHFHTCIAPALAKGQWVVVDRFIDSSIAYQGYGRCYANEKMINFIHHTHNIILNGQEPHITLWFDLPVEQALQRLQIHKDRFEKQNTRFFTRVREGYSMLCNHAPHRFIRIDASQTQKQVHAYIQKALSNYFSAQK